MALPRDPALSEAAAVETPRGGADPSDSDDPLFRAIESGCLDGPLPGDPELAKAVAAHRKLEGLFGLLREPAGLVTDTQDGQPMPERIGRYVIRGVLGHGTFGTVYLAHDPDLNRQVAVKAPRTGRFATAADADKFLAEARHAAGLKHPGIVVVHDVGRDDSYCYIVHEFVPGRTLAEVMKSERLSPLAAAKLLADVADALHYAHQHRFVHRDIKPANILLDEQGRPHVADFGLAVSEETQGQLAGQIAGTPAYMSPEQVRGETHRLDGRADIWSLGVIAYQLLTGRLPFRQENPVSLLDDIEHREPIPPRQIDDAIPAEFERIALRCLAKRATDRYPTALDLVEDLRHWQGIGNRQTGGYTKRGGGEKGKRGGGGQSAIRDPQSAIAQGRSQGAALLRCRRRRFLLAASPGRHRP
ncbi:MAG TPA: serine/threonine-protein kinase [Pirellulales bacterium]|nr:serine/threonine-protein kinase [Pirellulales bacterium]